MLHFITYNGWLATSSMIGLINDRRVWRPPLISHVHTIAMVIFKPFNCLLVLFNKLRNEKSLNFILHLCMYVYSSTSTYCFNHSCKQIIKIWKYIKCFYSQTDLQSSLQLSVIWTLNRQNLRKILSAKRLS